MDHTIRPSLLVRVVAMTLLFSFTSLAAPKTIDMGGLVLLVSDSSTAQTFHIVDQLSQWDSVHEQYVRWAEATKLLDQQDRKLLQQHAEMRKKRGWGHGFEQTFLVDDTIEGAAEKGVNARFLSAAEANAECHILLHFAPKFEQLLRQRQTEIAALEEQLVNEGARLTPTVVQLARFAEMKNPPTVMVFLVANTEERNGGGEANGGRFVVEVPSPDAIGILLHESLHRLLEPQQAAIRVAAESAGLDFTMMNEGIAHAFSPGITGDTDQGDQLADQIVRMELRGTPASDRGLQPRLVAAVIRPLLRATLAHNETLTAFLPQATAKWRSVSPR